MEAPAYRDRLSEPAEEPTDEILVAAAVAGDREAFDALACRYWPLVLRTAVQVVGRDRAEDAAQDAVLLAYRALPALKDPSRFPGWIATITRFRAIRLSRKESRRRATTVRITPVRQNHVIRMVMS